MLISMLLVGALLGGCGDGAARRAPATPPFAGIGAVATHDARQALLLGRIQQRYSVGLPEAGLSEYLRTQGFKTARRDDAGAPGQPIYGEARAKYGPGLCKMFVIVSWRGKRHGVLTELNVSHGTDGCV